MNTKALYNITYGVYLLSAKENGRDNACIINTAVQVANNPTRISIAAIKGNLTHDMILSTGVFNLSSITTDAPYSLFQHFGMQSGYNVNKFADFTDVARSENGLLYLTKYANAVLSLKVTESYDLGSHTLFIGELTDSEVLSSGECCSYGYYQSTIKKAAPKPIAKEGWKCKICGHVYEGKELPADYICPLCKHGAEDFEYFSKTTEIPATNINKNLTTIAAIAAAAATISPITLFFIKNRPFVPHISWFYFFLSAHIIQHTADFKHVNLYYSTKRASSQHFLCRRTCLRKGL